MLNCHRGQEVHNADFFLAPFHSQLAEDAFALFAFRRSLTSFIAWPGQQKGA
jgi:hypothetical protein